MNFCILPKLLHLNAEVGYEYRSFSIRQVQFSLISTMISICWRVSLWKSWNRWFISGNILYFMLLVRRVKRPACWLCMIIWMPVASFMLSMPMSRWGRPPGTTWKRWTGMWSAREALAYFQRHLQGNHPPRTDVDHSKRTDPAIGMVHESWQ